MRGRTFSRNEQFETSPEIELRPVVCEKRETDDLGRIIVSMSHIYLIHHPIILHLRTTHPECDRIPGGSGKGRHTRAADSCVASPGDRSDRGGDSAADWPRPREHARTSWSPRGTMTPHPTDTLQERHGIRIGWQIHMDW